MILCKINLLARVPPVHNVEMHPETMGSAYWATVCNFVHRACRPLKNCYEVASHSNGAKSSAGYYLPRGSVSYSQWSHIIAVA